jgi:hypothetical protein
MVVALALALATSVHAQIPRQFPPDAKLAELIGQKQPYPLLELDEKVLRLAPGGRVFDEHNRVILHSYLPKHAHVLYVLDMNGDVSRVYMLRPDELKEAQLREPKPESKPAPKPDPKRNPKRSGS